MLKVCKVSDIDDESINRFQIQDQDIVVGKHKGKLFACGNICPHKDAPMHKGWFNDDNIVCYMHYYEYDLENGKLDKIPKKWNKQSPEWRKSENLLIYDVIVKDEELFVDIRKS